MLSVPAAEWVEVEPQSASDWEVVEANAGFVEEHMLSQVIVCFGLHEWVAGCSGCSCALVCALADRSVEEEHLLSQVRATAGWGLRLPLRGLGAPHNAVCVLCTHLATGGVRRRYACVWWARGVGGLEAKRAAGLPNARHPDLGGCGCHPSISVLPAGWRAGPRPDLPAVGTQPRAGECLTSAVCFPQEGGGAGGAGRSRERQEAAMFTRMPASPLLL